MKLKKYLSDIRFWLGFHFLLRLIGITNPPYESGAWRQVITAMVAKNMVFGDFNLLLPKMDYFFMSMETTTGISPMEFPLFNAMGAIVSLVFGWHDWHLRLVNLVVSTLGIWYFYLLIKKFFSEGMAFFSAFILLQSIWWTYSRKIMPDTFSISLALISLYYAFEYFDVSSKRKSWWSLMLFLVIGTAGMLAKIPSSYLFGLILFPLLDKTITRSKKMWLIFSSLPFLSMVFWWYFIWSPYLIEKYNNRMFFMGKGLGEGLNEILAHLYQFSEHFTKFAFSLSGFILCLIALGFLIKKKDKLMWQLLILLSGSFGVFILKSGYNFIHHSYYIIPFVPVLSMLAGYGLEQIKQKKVVLLLLVVFSVDNFFRHQHDLRTPKRDHYRFGVPAIIDKYIPKDVLVAVNGGASPVDMYNLGRRGYSLEEPELTVENFALLKQRGVGFFVINRHGTKTELNEKEIFRNEDLIIYQLLPTL
ncbi:MAG: ArnT family glycosyltransferase [Bacteriovoracaceae bacterium]